MSEKESVSLEAALGAVQKMAALCESAQEAARHAAESPAALAEMRSLILESVQSLGSRAAESLGAADAFSSLAESYRRELAGLNGRGLEQAVRSWRTAFLKQAGTQLFNQLKETLQISQEAALTASQLAEGGLFPDAKSTGVFLLEIAERCGMTAPELSAQLLLKAFTAAPDLLADSNLPYLKEYVYHPGQSAQHSFRRCPVCGGTGGAYRAACSCLINSFDPMFLPAKLWMKCPDCGNLYTYWFPEAFLALGKQPRLIAPQEGQVRVQAANSVLLRSWNDILNHMQQLQGGSDRSLLEVGVGDGSLIAVALEMGYEVTAVEILESTAQNAANLLHHPILCGDFLQMPEDRQFPLITMGDVLEHLQDPAEGLRKAHRMLCRDGVLWLSTPNYESAFSTMMKCRDPMWREPYHITYFSRRGLCRLLEQVGFQVEEYAVSRHYNGSMELLLRKREPA